MVHTKKVGSSGRFGSRYGRKVRFKVRTVEAKQRKRQECPNCGKLKVKRVSKGIFECSGCGAVIAGNAYTLK